MFWHTPETHLCLQSFHNINRACFYERRARRHAQIFHRLDELLLPYPPIFRWTRRRWQDEFDAHSANWSTEALDRVNGRREGRPLPNSGILRAKYIRYFQSDPS